MLHSGVPAYNSNQNTKRLVAKTFAKTPEWSIIQAAIKAQTPELKSLQRSRAIGTLISHANASLLRGDSPNAVSELQAGLTGDLEREPDIMSALGYVHKRSTPPDIESARRCFERAYEW